MRYAAFAAQARQQGGHIVQTAGPLVRHTDIERLRPQRRRGHQPLPRPAMLANQNLLARVYQMGKFTEASFALS